MTLTISHFSLKWTVTAFVLLVIGGSSNRSWADLLKVPNDHLTIQQAIDASTAGDTIVVASGTYHLYTGNLTFTKGSITLKSSFGPDTAILQGSGDGPVVTFPESCNAKIQGFTITRLSEASETSLRGGAIYCGKASSPTIIDCVITKNRAVHGGGIYCDEMSAPTIDKVIFTENRAEVSGGGVFAFKAFPTVVRSRMRANHAANTGGGFHSYQGSPRIMNTVIWKNTALSGAGVSCDESLSSIVNCTITENRAASYGGGILFDGGATKIINDIIWKNTDDLYSESFGPASRPDHTNISDGDFLRVNSNLSADPMFVKPEEGDFRLLPESPCIDAGHPAAIYTDLDGSRNDMGAYGGPEAEGGSRLDKASP